MDDFDVLFFAVSADVVGFADFPFLQNGQDGFTVIDNIKPVADIFAVAVNRQGFSLKGVVDDQRNELFRKLVRSIVIGAVGNQRRQSIGMKIRADQMVGGRLAGGIRRPGIIRGGFLKSAGFSQRAVNLIRADMQKTAVLIRRAAVPGLSATPRAPLPED